MKQYSESLNKSNSESHISNYSDLLFNGIMKTIDEIRRKNLSLAIKKVKTAAALAAMTGSAAAYLSQIKNAAPDSKTGTPKTMGDDLARRIESAIGESAGWMDQDHSEDAPVPPAEQEGFARRPPRLQLVDDDEQELLHEYRRMGPGERELLLQAAREMPKKPLSGLFGINQP